MAMSSNCRYIAQDYQASNMSHKQGNNASIVTAKAGVYYHKGGMHANNAN
jgi:hypothetical protein